MDTFFWSLVLAAVSALTFIAYKHPTGFSRNIFPFLITMITVSVVGATAWYLGEMKSLTESLSSQVTNAKESINIPSFVANSIVKQYLYFEYTISISLVVAAYLLILKYLPRIISTENNKN